MIQKIAIATAIALMASTASIAKVYVGGAVGQASTEHNVSNVNFDESSTGWKLYGGFRFFKFFGVEASYVDFGSPDGTVSGVTWQADSKGYDAFAVGALPLGSHFELFAKAGFVYVKTDETTAGSLIRGNDTAMAYGAGAAFIFRDHLGVRLEVEKFEVKDLDNLWMYSLGVEFRF